MQNQDSIESRITASINKRENEIASLEKQLLDFPSDYILLGKIHRLVAEGAMERTKLGLFKSMSNRRAV